MTVTTSHYHVFLSHHAADQPAVEAIARLLRAVDLTAFLDRWHLVPGDPWMEAIEEALATSETVAVFVGPSGIGPWQNEEMRVALYDSAVRGKRVIPVLLPGADPQRVSPFLTRRTWVDFRAGPEDADALQRLITGIQGRPSEAGGYLSPIDLALPKHYFAPFQAPPLPPYFVPRPEAAEAIRSALLDARSETPGVLAISAIHGLGGIGKTTLIAALAHDPAIRQRYPDGILWATLGQQPELFPRLFEWIQQLGDYTFKPTTLEGASSHLRTLLIDKACLLVVDDAWQREHVDHFLVGGARSQVVITTRDATLARKLRAHLHDLDVMTEAQALALFEGRLGALSAGNGRDQAAALARELGYLPLALELAAAQVEAGRSWIELLAHFQSAFADLAILDLDEAARRDESLRISFALTLDSLTEEDHNAFVWFGVLREDAIIGPPMSATLWEETETQVRERLRRLHSKALLKPADQDRYTLHDLLHDEARHRLSEQMPIGDAHSAFLARYAVQCQRKSQTEHDAQVISGSVPLTCVLWHTLPDDEYILVHLIWHMEQAGQIDAIHSLFREESASGHHGWYNTLSRYGKIATFAVQLAQAWKLAGRDGKIALQVLYSLAVATLNSLASQLTPEMMRLLIVEGIWSIPEALSYARLMPDHYQRALTLATLIPFLPLDDRDLIVGQAIEATTLIRDRGSRCDALMSILPNLHREKRQFVLAEVLDAIHAMGLLEGRSEALARIVPHLSDSQLSNALMSIEDIEGIEDTSRALKILAPRLSEEQMIETLGIVSTFHNERERSQALITLAPYLKSDLLLNALEIACNIEHEFYRFSSVLELIATLPENQRIPHIREAEFEAKAIRDPENRALALAKLAHFVVDPEREQMLSEALIIARGLMFASEKTRVLRELALSLSGQRQLQVAEEALAASRMSEYASDFTETVATLAPILTEQQTCVVLPMVDDIVDEFYRSLAYRSLVPHTPASHLGMILESTQSMQDEANRSETLIALLPFLTKDLLAMVFAEAHTIQKGTYRSSLLKALLPYLSEDQLGIVLQEVRNIEEPRARWEVLKALANHLPETERYGAVQEALRAAQVIEDGAHLSATLASLIVHLAEEPRTRFLHEAVETSLSMRSEEDGLEALIPLLPYLSENQRVMVSQVIQTGLSSIEFQNHYFEIAPQILPYLPVEQQQQSIAKAFTAIRTIGYPPDRSKALIFLAPHVSENQLDELFLQMQATFDGRSSYRILASLPLSLLETHNDEALIAAQTIADAWSRSRALVAISIGFSSAVKRQQILSEALIAAQAIEDDIYRLDALSALVPHLPEEQVALILSDAFAIMSASQEKGIGSAAMAKLAQHLSDQELAVALAGIELIESDYLRSNALSEITPYLPERLLVQAMQMAYTLDDKQDRSQVICVIASRLERLNPWEISGIFSQALHAAANRTRCHLLSDLCSLMPVIAALATPDDMAEIAQAIVDVGRWWP